MTRIWERLYLGSLADAEYLAEANPQSISTVITLCEDCVASQRRGVNYLHIPVADDRPVPLGRLAVLWMPSVRTFVGAPCSSIAGNVSAGLLISPPHGWLRSATKPFMRHSPRLGSCSPFINPPKTLLNRLREHLL